MQTSRGNEMYYDGGIKLHRPFQWNNFFFFRVFQREKKNRWKKDIWNAKHADPLTIKIASLGSRKCSNRIRLMKMSSVFQKKKKQNKEDIFFLD